MDVSRGDHRRAAIGTHVAPDRINGSHPFACDGDERVNSVLASRAAQETAAFTSSVTCFSTLELHPASA